jgi:HEAT repeat protein
VEPLIGALRDRDWNVCVRAAEALVKIGEPAVEPLIGALRDGNWNVRSRAAKALGKIGDRRALPALRARLGWIRGDPEPDVREACRKAITEIEAATG